MPFILLKNENNLPEEGHGWKWRGTYISASRIQIYLMDFTCWYACSADLNIVPKTFISVGKKFDSGFSFPEKHTTSSCVAIYERHFSDPGICPGFSHILQHLSYSQLFLKWSSAQQFVHSFFFSRFGCPLCDIVHRSPAHVVDRGKNLFSAIGSMYTKRFPFIISVIRWVVGCLIFSYLMSLVSLAPNFSSMFFTHVSSTDKGIPFTNTSITFSSGDSVPGSCC